MTFVNGQKVTEPNTPLQSGSRVIIGEHHVFRFTNPIQARQRLATDGSSGNLLDFQSPGKASKDTSDWQFAQRELLKAQGLISGQTLEDIEKKKELEIADRVREMEERFKYGLMFSNP